MATGKVDRWMDGSVMTELVHEDGKHHTRQTEDTGAVAEWAASIRNAGNPGRPNGKITRAIPVSVYNTLRAQWQQKWADTFTWQRYLDVKLSQPEYRQYQTADTVGRKYGGDAYLASKV